MKRLQIVLYTYKPHLDDTDLRTLTKEFLERGSSSSVIAHYERLDGRGGVIVQEVAPEADLEADYERTLVHGKYMEFEVLLVTTIEDAVPTILKLYA
jgi:hypothetical protein